MNHNCDDMRPQTVRPLFAKCDPLNAVDVEYSWQGLADRGFCWSQFNYFSALKAKTHVTASLSAQGYSDLNTNREDNSIKAILVGL